MKSDYKWLEKWKELIQGKLVLELGAGSGIDTKNLRNIASSLTSTDLIANNSKVIEKLDHSKPLPYKSDSFDVVIASLCLHYFEWSKTKEIVCELNRILKPDGLLIARVNSKADTNYGSIDYPKIETGLYKVNNQTKRFFNKTDITSLLQNDWVLLSIEEKQIDIK